MRPEESDEQLYLLYLAKRDEDALRTLIERHRDSLTLFLYGLVHSMEDAEDLMLDAFAAAAARNSWSMSGSSFKTWLFAVGRKKALMHLRKNKIPVLPITDDLPDENALPDLPILREEEKQRIYRALEALSPDYRQALTLLYFDDMTHEEAAKVMRKTKKQMYHLVSRGRERLKQILEAQGEGKEE